MIIKLALQQYKSHLAEMTTFHMSQALSYDQSRMNQNRITVFDRSGVSSKWNIVCDQSGISSGIKFSSLEGEP